MNIKIISTNRRCDSNVLDFLKVKLLLDKAKLRIVEEEKEADLVLIVSCASIFLTRDFTIKKIHELAKKNLNRRVIVYGCFSKIMREKINCLKRKYTNVIFLKEVSEIRELLKIDELVEEENTFFDEKVYDYLRDDPEKLYKLLKRILHLLSFIIKDTRKVNILNNILHKNKINIFIGKGCAGKCSYCYIKKSRGYINSRDELEIISDINKNKSDFEIINLTGDDCSSWGLDKNKKFYQLLEILLLEFPNKCFEVRYINPALILGEKEKYLEIFSRRNFILINICIQSGSDKVLKLMNRDYKINDVLLFISELKKMNPRLILKTHVIVQYPGETVYDFIKTLKAVLNFDIVNCYVYTPPPGERLSFKEKLIGKFKKSVIDLYNLISFFKFRK